MRWLLVPLLAMPLSIGALAVEPRLAEPQIWIAPIGRADAANMWTKDAPWQEAAKKVKVLVLVHHTISLANIPRLIEIRDFAKAHNWQIDLSTEAVGKMDNETCGGQEGYSWPGENRDAAKILFDLGIKVDWVDMDGPIMSGSHDPSPTGCGLSMADLIPRVAATLKGVFALYPNARLMHGEPLPSLQQTPNWRQTLDVFHAGLTQILGVRVVGMQADVHWTDPAWPQAMRDLHTHLRQNNQLLSVIYNPTEGIGTDADATRTMVENFEAVEGGLSIVPDIALIESWVPNPVNAMPETSPTAEMWVVNRYPRPRSRLQVQFVGQSARGKLTTLDGKPIANATVNGFKPGVDFSKPLPVTSTQGTVPANAVAAFVIVRINTENSGDGLNHLLFGTLGYRETVGGTAAFDFSWRTNFQRYGGTIVDGQLVGGTIVTEVYAPPGQSFAPNSDSFPVTPGAQYNFTVPAATIGGRGW